MIQAKAAFSSESLLSDDEVRNVLSVLASQFNNQRVLVLIPDHTRSLPLHFLFCSLVEILHTTKPLDFMVALGMIALAGR